MGRIAKILSFIRVVRNDANLSDVKVDPGGGSIITAEHFGPPGDDSHPLSGDYIYTSPTRRSGGEAAVGYIDPKNTPAALPGEKRIYARDAAGAVVSEFWLKNDGSVICSNAAGSFELQAAGTIVLNGVTIDVSGNITTSGTVGADTVQATTSSTVGGSELLAHVHGGVTAGGANTGPLV